MFKIDIYFKNLQKCKLNISGIEPEALGLKVHCSTTELYIQINLYYIKYNKIIIITNDNEYLIY